MALNTSFDASIQIKQLIFLCRCFLFGNDMGKSLDEWVAAPHFADISKICTFAG